MKKPARPKVDPQQLRRQAEERVALAPAAKGDPADDRRLLHELQVHQVELEIQNAELERSRAEAEEARDRYTDLYEFAPVGYLTLGRGGELEELNLTAAQQLGVERALLRGRRLGSLVSPESAGPLAQFLQHVFSGGERGSCELVIRAGSPAPMTVELTGVRQGDGATCRAAMQDVTEKKALQVAVAQADRLASIGLLAAGVGHEINNPLTSVLFGVEHLANELPRLRAAVDRETLADLEAQAHQALDGLLRIKEIARGLTTFFRLDHPERRPVDVRRALDTALKMTSNELKFRARLTKDYAEVPPVSADEGRLTQVFLNLLINAAQAIDHAAADPRISLRVWQQGGRVLAEVKDNGPGIAEVELAQIFEPFFSTKGPGAGSGLGLSISRNIVNELGGELRVSSAPGEGASFVVSLPATSEPAAPPQKEPRPEPVAAAVRGRLLVIDDEHTLTVTLSRLLGRVHDVVALESALAAQELLTHDVSFDVILCDLMMPEMTGMALHEWLASRAPAAASRMVFMTGGAFTPKASQYLAGLPNVTVQKPFVFDELLTLIAQRVIARRREVERSG